MFRSLFKPQYLSNTRRLFHSSSSLNQIIYPSCEAFVGKHTPTFTATSVINGEIKELSLSDYAGKWVVLMFYPLDFTFVCPTEITSFSDRHDEFEAINAQVIGISVDSQFSHIAWTKQKRTEGGLGDIKIPLVSDLTKVISAKYGVLIEEAGISLRGNFIINPDGVLEQSSINNTSVGRNVDESLRLIQAFQYNAEHGEVCPANWTPGAPAMEGDPKGSLNYFKTLED